MQSTLAPSNAVELLDTSTFTLKRTGQRPIRFDGVKLASAETSAERTSPDWSGEAGFCHQAAIYRTAARHYVLEYATFSPWRVEIGDSYQVFTADTLDDLLDIVENKEVVSRRVADRLIEALGSKLDIAEELD